MGIINIGNSLWKKKIANALTEKGVPTDTNSSIDTIIANIKKISLNMGNVYKTSVRLYNFERDSSSPYDFTCTAHLSRNAIMLIPEGPHWNTSDLKYARYRILRGGRFIGSFDGNNISWNIYSGVQGNITLEVTVDKYFSNPSALEGEMSLDVIYL